MCRAIVIVVALVAAACDGVGKGQPTVSTTTVLATNPPDGAADVDPGQPVLLDILWPTGNPQAGDVHVRDGGNELAGELIALGGTRWRWQPVGELPRGNTVAVHTAGQGRVAAFGVREAIRRREFFLPDLAASAAYAWPTGRMAVRADDRWFEVTADGPQERSVGMPANLVTFGDGQALFFEVDPGNQVVWSVRSGLDGERDRIVAPGGAVAVAVNRRGDAVLLVPASWPEPTERGLWRLMDAAVAWQLAGPIEVPIGGSGWGPLPCIDRSGAVCIVSDGPQPEFRRYAQGSLIVERHALPSEAAGAWLVGADDGVCQVLWTVSNGVDPAVLRGARYVPGAGLEEPRDLVTWPAAHVVPHLSAYPGIAASGGSSVALLQVQAFAMPSLSQWVFVRVERDGSTTVPTVYSSNSAGLLADRIVASRDRAELWVVRLSLDARRITARRSRPGSDTEASVELFALSDPGVGIGSYHVAADDSGRVLVAANVVVAGGVLVGTRIAIIE